MYGNRASVYGGPDVGYYLTLEILLDSDDDGISDWEEAIAGTDPYNSASYFAITGTSIVPEGCVIYWDSVIGRRYTVLWSNDLTSGFEVMASGIEYPQNSYVDTLHADDGCGFYLILVEWSWKRNSIGRNS